MRGETMGLVIAFVILIIAVFIYLRADDKNIRLEWKKIGELNSQVVMCQNQIKALQDRCAGLALTDGNLKNQAEVFKKELEDLHDHFSEVQTAQRANDIKTHYVEERVSKAQTFNVPTEISFVLVDKRAKPKVNFNENDGGANGKKEQTKQDQTPRPDSKPTRARKAALGRSYSEIERKNSK